MCSINVEIFASKNLANLKDKYVFIFVLNSSTMILADTLVHLPSLEVLHDASIDLLEHLQVLSLTKHYVRLRGEGKNAFTLTPTVTF